jgi:DNA N-6-adenine-methyltransferase (Dam)
LIAGSTDGRTEVRRPIARIARAAAARPHLARNTANVEWYTTKPIVELARAAMGAIDLDPASCDAAQAVVQATRYYTLADDGLALPWTGRVFLNPPYARALIRRFCGKLLAELTTGRVTAAVTLTNNATETRWGQTLLGAADAVCFWKGRIDFWGPNADDDSPLQGQILCYFGPAPERFVALAAPFGQVFLPMRPPANPAALAARGGR